MLDGARALQVGFRFRMVLASLLQAFSLVQEGVKSNWWGLACPSHCSAGLGGLVAAFLLGLIVGVLLTGLAAFYFYQAFRITTFTSRL